MILEYTVYERESLRSGDGSFRGDLRVSRVAISDASNEPVSDVSIRLKNRDLVKQAGLLVEACITGTYPTMEPGYVVTTIPVVQRVGGQYVDRPVDEKVLVAFETKYLAKQNTTSSNPH